MEQWQSKLEEYTERCDFNGLPKTLSTVYPSKNDLVPYGLRNIKMDGFPCKSMPSPSSSLIALINLGWHKTLAVYGNGIQTVTLTCSNVTSPHQKIMLIPLILDHSKCSTKTICEILKEIEIDMMNSTSNNLAVDAASQLPENFCDAVILFDDIVIKMTTPFTIKVATKEDALDLWISYSKKLFDDALIDGLLGFFQTVMEKLSEERHQASILSSIDFLPANQKEQLENWNANTTGKFPVGKRLHHLVEEAAAKTPDNVAVICQDTQLSYGELNKGANQVGHYLHSKVQVEVEQFIALFLDKTEVLLMTLLGIWKAGAAYIPIDPAYPNERIKFILEDSAARILIANGKYRERLVNQVLQGDSRVKIIDVEELFEMARKMPTHDLNLPLRSNQLAYVTYTSGTTGVPKGVYKEHLGVVNSITDLSIRYEMREKPEVVVLFSAYVFEPFVRQTLIALVNSQVLVVANDIEKLDQHKFHQFLEKHRVTYLNGTGSVLEEYDLGSCKTLSKLILVGEELTKARYERLRGKYEGRIICEYGFTESALVTCMNVFDLGDERIDRSIGRPLRNVKAYIVDKDMKQVSVGTIGDLYIGGVGISRGYMNRASLTKERFLPNPFQTPEEKKDKVNRLMYKTGDLARWLWNGQIEYIGRNDFQIKLRGNRIEPAEIESVVLQYPLVSKCTVAVKDSKSAEESTASSRHLVGYFVATQEVQEEELINYLERKLPIYMIPVRMVQVDDIRTNINGKVDLNALPEVLFSKTLTMDKVEKPRNEVDSKLIKMWSDALGIPESEILISSDFFRLGGHSITCIQLVSKIRQELSVEVSIDDIFTLRSIQKLSDYISKQRESQEDQLQRKKSFMKNIPGREDEKKEIIANSLQQGLVYHYLRQGEKDDAYMMQSHYRYLENLNVEIYKKAWQSAQIKYSSLRLQFKVREKMYQIFGSTESQLDWTFLDIRHNPDKDKEVGNIITADRERRYKLELGNLFRIYLIKEEDSKYSLIFSYHHVILDGWSIPILFAFVHNAYQSILEGKAPPSSDTDTSSVLSQRYFQEHRKEHLKYWTGEIEQVEERVNLSGLLKPRLKYKVQLSNHSKIEVQKQLTQEVSCELVNKLRVFGVRHGVTLHSILQFAWHKVLHSYGGGSHTIVGTTVSGRNIPVDGIENAVGLLINTLPLVVDHGKIGDMKISLAIQEIQRKVNSINSKSTVELGKLKLGGGNGELKQSLFDSLFVLEPTMEMGSFLGFSLVKDYEKLDYPLAVIAREGNGGILKFALLYAGELFEEQVIREILQLLESILVQVVGNWEEKVNNLRLVLPEQLDLMERWNETRTSFPEDKTLHEIFEEAVIPNPNKIALIYENKRWSYKLLNRIANKLAFYLRSLASIKADDKIALILEKNDLLIVSILGVWKSGAAFVPIDPGYPEERIKFMLDDTQSKLVIINGHNKSKLGGVLGNLTPNKIIGIENVVMTLCDSNCDDVPQLPRVAGSRDLCYVFYTSGTTGQPKGVMTEHLGVVNLHHSLSTIFQLRSTPKPEVFLSFSNFVFDHFVEQMTDALLSGQTLVILNDDMRSDKERLYKYIQDNQVTYLSGTPSVLSLYEYAQLPSITRIDAVGEDFTEAYFDKVRKTFTSGVIINGYGPTETSITTHKRIYKAGERRTDKSIGHQIHNSTCYILNKVGQMVPIGAVGELYLGGVGVGRGYLNREELTNQLFLENPFATEQDIKDGRNLRIYKTGDLARFLPNGEVECLGRNDFQVKVRGLRIELSEIETVLASHPGITQCVVVAQNNEHSASKVLVGYYVSNSIQNEATILAYLRSKLPSFMMPHRLVQMDSIPVTINGKCNVKQLPQVTWSPKSNENLNWSEIEIKLRFIWAELLCLPLGQIGADDDFFSLGGDSLLVTSMTFMIHKAFGKIVGVPQVFLHKTLKSLGQFISTGRRHHHYQGDIPKTDEFQRTPVSLAQERLLFIDEMESGTCAFNVPFLFKLNKKADIGKVVESFKLVVKRHESLRTLLVKWENSYSQKLITEEQLEAFWPHSILMKEVNSWENGQEEIVHSENYIFKLDQQLPVRITLVKDLERMESFVSVVFHHTCFDGWSFDIFQRDWKYFCSCLHSHDNADDAKNVLDQLPKLDYNYKEFSLLQRRMLSGPDYHDVSSYWLGKLSDVEQLDLPTDFERPSQFLYSGHQLCRHLDSKLMTTLKDLAKRMKTSLYSILASALALTLSIFSGQEEILIGSPVSNRIRSEFENTIGFFINILPLRFLVAPNTTVEEFIESVGAEVVTSHVYQDMPFEKLVKELKINRDLSRHPLVQVMLNYNPLTGLRDSSSLRDEDTQPFQLIDDILENKDTTAKYDLSVTVSQIGDGHVVNFTFATQLFCQATVERYLNIFLHCLSAFSQPENWSRNIMELVGRNIPITKLEQRPLTNSESSHVAASLGEIFEKVASTCGNRTALVYKNKHVSYNELSMRSTKLAYLLKNKLISAGSGRKIVALVMNKSDWMVASILGVWKAGAAYVPIDPTYPKDRIKFILKDTAANLIISDQVNYSLVRKIIGEENKAKIEIVIIDQPQTINEMEHVAELVHLNDAPLEKPELCYIIYTSGSTGLPKGVMITHNNVISFRNSLLEYHKKHGVTVLFLSNFVFDFSIEQIILSIFNWGTLIIVDDFGMDDQFYSHLNKHHLSYLSGTPSFVSAFDLTKLTHLKTVTVAGEKLKKSQFTKIRSEFTGKLINAYGLTETTVYNSVCVFHANDNKYENSLGTIFSNTSYYLLDKELRPVPEGAVAGLYLAGPCLSPGYLNEEDVKSSNFERNAFPNSVDISPVLYRTGDLVRLKPSGTLEYLRREDHQVKIRGFRIETEEIECVLLKHDKVKECAVICTKDSRLVCFYVTKTKVGREELCSFLELTLPSYMMPCLIEYEGNSLPVTINGKLDSKELRNIYKKSCKLSSSPDAAPATKVETIIRQIFSSVLSIPEEDIGVYDDLFEQLGGDSLSSLFIPGKIRNQLGLQISIKNVFENPTIRKLAKLISSQDLVINPAQLNGIGNHEGKLVKPSGDVPLLPIQKWFFAKNLKSPNHYSQTFSIEVPCLDTGRLTKSLKKLISLHDVFRLNFQNTSHNHITQQYQIIPDNEAQLNFHKVDVTGMTQDEISKRLSNACTTIDIENGPLYYVAYLEDRANNKFKIWWLIHHLIVDSVSWRIIKDDLHSLYQRGNLVRKGTSYQEYSLWLKDRDFLGEKPYWSCIVDQATIYNAHLMRMAERRKLSFNFSLDQDVSRRLLRHTSIGGEKTGSSTQDYLVTGVGYALAQLTGSATNYITVEGHGRDPRCDVTNTVGWFTTMYPVKIRMNPETDVESNIKEVSRSLRSVPNKGTGYGLIYGYVDPPLPCVSFNFLGNFGYTLNSNEGEWNLCDLSLGLSTGDNERTTGSVIDITVACEKGCLKFSLDFLLKRDVCKEFLSHFQAVLHNISKTRSKVSIDRPSPFGNYEVLFDFPAEIKCNITLFILPPGEGGGESYFHNLVPSLKKQFNLIVFNNYYLDCGIETTFEKLASMYIHYVKGIQPEGPYSFLGWSFGGVLALEMSRQLAHSGDLIQNLFLIDSYLNLGKAVEDLNLLEKGPIIDVINHKYTPSAKDFDWMMDSFKTKEIVLFKAILMNEMYKTREQKILYEYFQHSLSNNLDTLILPEFITVKEIQGHNSWAKDSKQIKGIVNVVIDKLQFSSNTHLNNNSLRN